MPVRRHPIRLATLSDAADIARMSRETIEFGLPWTWRPERIARAIRRTDTNVVVVRDAGLLLGFGVMSYLEDDAHLLLFAVDPARRREGIGTAILGWLEDVARAAGAKRIRLETRRESVDARCFYSEMGYHELVIKRGMYEQGVDGVRLEKWLGGAGGSSN
ncbi:MAG: GNAT family N-acetyltransferase [Burkholderiales bacterium]|nr:GNAT family N-acetyltransferase [Burkholderiales bacterium]